MQNQLTYTIEQAIDDRDRAAIAALLDTETTPEVAIPEFEHGTKEVTTTIRVAPGIAVITTRTVITSRIAR